MLSFLSLFLSLHLSPDLIALSGASFNVLIRFSRQRVAGGGQDFRHPACLNGALLALNADSPSPLGSFLQNSASCKALWEFILGLLLLLSCGTACAQSVLQALETGKVRGEFHSLKDLNKIKNKI